MQNSIFGTPSISKLLFTRSVLLKIEQEAIHPFPQISAAYIFQAQTKILTSCFRSQSMQCRKPFHTVKAIANEKIPNGNCEGLI